MTTKPPYRPNSLLIPSDPTNYQLLTCSRLFLGLLAVARSGGFGSTGGPLGNSMGAPGTDFGTRNALLMIPGDPLCIRRHFEPRIMPILFN